MNIEEIAKGQEFLLIWQNITSRPFTTRELDFARAVEKEVAAAVAKRCADLCQQIAYSHQAAPMLGPELNSLNCARAIRREFGEVSK